MLLATARYGKYLVGLWFIISWLLAAPTRSFADDSDVAVQVIVNAGVELPHQLNNNTLRAIFFGRMLTWPNGDPIKVFVLPYTHPLHQAFSQQVLKTFPYVLQRQWEQLTYTGTGTAPEEVATTYQLQAEVESTRGAIGYARRSAAHTGTVRFVGGEKTNTKEAGTL